MTLLDPTQIVGLQALTPTTAPRDVGAASAEQFRHLMQAPATQTPTTAGGVGSTATPAAAQRLGLDIEQALMAHLPPPNASPAEFAVGLLRAQVAVSQAAIGIELLSKTTQSLSQGVQSLTSRS